MTSKEQEILSLPVEAIHPNPHQPRRFFSADALEELADSIRTCGILQPLTVRQTDSGWELVAGERRLRAAKLAGLSTVPCLERTADEQEAALWALVENLQRQDLHFFEEAAAIAAFLQSTGLSREETAQRLGKSPSALANKLRLLRLSPACREVLLQAGLSERHARCLLRLEDEGERLRAVRHMADAHLNVSQSEAYIQHRLDLLQSTPPNGRRTVIIKDVRLFLNSVDRGVRLIREAGIDAVSGREETEDSILLTIRIPKQHRDRPARDA